MLPIVLSTEIVDRTFNQVNASVGYKLNVDLSVQTVTTPSGQVYTFEVDAVRKRNLINGLDEIGLTMQQQDKIKEFEAQHKQAQPWLFN